MTAVIDTTADAYSRRAAFYRVEYDERRDIDFFLSLIEIGKTEVLEVPCGAGRLTAHLARKARHVTAVDLEPAMVHSLDAFMRAEGLSDKVTAIVGDMTSLSLPRPVDLVIVPSEALQLLPRPSGRVAIETLMDRLKPGGRMVIDLAMFTGPEAGTPDYFDPASEGSRWRSQWVRSLPDGSRLGRSVRFRRENDSCVFGFSYEITGEPGTPPHRFSEEMVLFHYDAPWFLKNLPPSVAAMAFQSGYDGTGSALAGQRLIVTLQKSAT
jgi:SAM-dependent methyltransferase